MDYIALFAGAGIMFVGILLGWSIGRANDNRRVEESK
jgi:hypothetical protein